MAEGMSFSFPSLLFHEGRTYGQPEVVPISLPQVASAAVIIYFGESIKKTLSVNLLLLFVLSQGVYVGLRCYLKNQLNTKLY